MIASVDLRPKSKQSNCYVIIPGLDEVIIRELGQRTYGSMTMADIPELMHYKNIQSFVSSASMEEKLFVLGRMGFRFNFTLKDENRPSLNKTQWKAILDGEDATSIANSLAQTGTFCFGDADVMRSLAVMSTVGNSFVYKLTREYVDILTRIKMVKDIDTLLDFNNTRESLSLFHKLLVELYCINAKQFFVQGVNELQYIILVTLFETGGAPMRKSTLFSKPYINQKKGTMQNNMTFMTKAKLVETIKIGGEVCYSITGKGSSVIAELARMIIKKIL